MNTLVIEIIGVIAFAISGSMVAIKNKMDVVGTVILANITSFGGGALRDILIGYFPPKLLSDPLYLIYIAVATGSSILFMVLICTIKPFKNGIKSPEFNFVLNTMDAVGLAPFVIVGVNIALDSGMSNIVSLAIIGCISGCGGGIFRDILAHQIPIVFRKYIYILPCLAGVVTYILLLQYTSVSLLAATIIGFGIIIAGRMCGIIFKINMPVIDIDDDAAANDSKTK